MMRPALRPTTTGLLKANRGRGWGCRGETAAAKEAPARAARGDKMAAGDELTLMVRD
jgi:hypothetical protein